MGKGNRRNTGNTASGTHKINGSANGKKQKSEGIRELRETLRHTRNERRKSKNRTVSGGLSSTHTAPLENPHTTHPRAHTYPLSSSPPHTYIHIATFPTPPHHQPSPSPPPPPRTCPRSGLPESLVAGRQDARRKVESATRAGDHGGGKAESRSQTGW